MPNDFYNFHVCLRLIFQVFSLLIPAILLSLILVSCNREENVAVTGVSLNRDTQTVAVGHITAFNARIEPSGATNRNVIWSSSNLAVATTVVNKATGYWGHSGQNLGWVTAVSAGTAIITATTQDGGYTATGTITVVPGVSGCNFDTPGWGETLGTVSFYTDNEWVIEGNGISQIWSDAVTATACQKTTRNSGGWGNLNADCYSNPDFPGDLFNWCAVVRFADQLCPYPWRVPTQQDFIDLDIALGGTGNNRNATYSNIATPQFVTDNFINRWGGAFGGRSDLSGEILIWDPITGIWTIHRALSDGGSWGHYWSLSEYDWLLSKYDPNRRVYLTFSKDGDINPRGGRRMNAGLALRCVR